jgi:hypothetical protein
MVSGEPGGAPADAGLQGNARNAKRAEGLENTGPALAPDGLSGVSQFSSSYRGRAGAFGISAERGRLLPKLAFRRRAHFD